MRASSSTAHRTLACWRRSWTRQSVTRYRRQEPIWKLWRPGPQCRHCSHKWRLHPMVSSIYTRTDADHDSLTFGRPWSVSIGAVELYTERERNISMALTVNGEERETPNPRRNLLSYLRYDLGLTGTKYGCGEGLCGACTVLVDDQPLKSCMSTVSAVAGGSITTIDGVATNESLHKVQQAFIEESAMQCGYCIPGFIMAAIGLLEREPRPSRDTVRQALSSNLCRCGTYLRIERAVIRAAGGPR